MLRTLLPILLLASTALTASAQHVLIDPIASFKPPFNIVEGAFAETADGTVYGLYVGGNNGGIYRVRPDGAGGFETTVVYEFGDGEESPVTAFRVNGILNDLMEAGPDGRIYFANAFTLLRFDPAAGTLETLHALPPDTPSSVIFGHDGQTVYGSNRSGVIYSFDTVSHQYREIARLGAGVSGIQQMLDGNLVAVHDGFGGVAPAIRRVNPVSGAVTAEVVRERSVMMPPSKGDDGQIYIQTSDSGDRVSWRVDVSCFCLRELHRIPWPNDSIPSTIAGARDGHLYINWHDNPHRINLNVTPPVLEQIATAGGFNYQMLSTGTMLVTAHDANGRPIVNAVDVDSATPGTLASVTPFTSAPVNDGLAGFPRRFTVAPDGALYGVAAGRSRLGSIFRIDPITKARAVVAEIDFGEADMSAGATVYPMVAAPDGMFYGSYVNNRDASSAIFRFDPTANATTILREFAYASPSTTDGTSVAQLTLGTDGWLYGVTQSSLDETTNFSGTVFKLDPATGAFVTIARPTLPLDFYPLGDMVETSPGVWYLNYFNNSDPYCGAIGRLDAATGDFTTVVTIDIAAHGCAPEALLKAHDGTVLARLANGPDVSPSAIFRLDPETHAFTMIYQFTENLYSWSWVNGADGKVYSTYSIYNSWEHVSSGHGLFRLDPATGAATTFVDTTQLGGAITFANIAHDGRIIINSGSSRSFVVAIAILDEIAVMPASGPADGSTSISATLKAIGVPVPGVTIAFTLNGASIGSAVTNALGVATLANVNLNGIAVGTHANVIGASFAGNDRFPATMGSGSLTVIDVPTPGLAVGVGLLRDGQRQTDFAYAVLETTNGLNSGAFELESKLKKSRDRFSATSITSMRFGNGSVTFSGKGKWNGQANYRFDVVATESDRRFRGALKVMITSPSGSVVLSVDDELLGGLIESIRLR